MASCSQAQSTGCASDKRVSSIARPMAMKKFPMKLNFRHPQFTTGTPIKANPTPSKGKNKTAAKETLLKHIGTSIVHIKVGRELKDFGIHKSLICHYSPFFQRAFNSDFEEGRTGVMRMEETKVEIFALFFAWLYSQDAWWNADQDPESSQETLIDLYLLADMVQIPDLKNAALGRLREILRGADYVKQIKSVSMFNFIWDNTIPSSPIQRLMIDLCVWDYQCTCIFTPVNANIVPPETYAKIVNAMWIRSSGKSKTNPLKNLSNYTEPGNMEYKA